MASYALAMGTIALFLHRSGRAGRRPRRSSSSSTSRRSGARWTTQGLWDDADGLFYDRLVTPDGTAVPVKVRSMVGIIPMLAAGVVDEPMLDRASCVGKSFPASWTGKASTTARSSPRLGLLRGGPGHRGLLLGVVGIDRLERLFAQAVRRGRVPLPARPAGASPPTTASTPTSSSSTDVRAAIDYEPAESTTAMFGGNSNWRGPVWFPLNYLVISALERYDRFFGDDFTVEYPTGSGRQLSLGAIVADLRERLVSIFTGRPGRAAALLRRGRAACSTTRPGRTTCCSTSTSTATTAPGSAPPTRPVGPGWSPT